MINQNFIKVVSAGSAVGLLTGRRTLQGYPFSKQVCAKCVVGGGLSGLFPLLDSMDFKGFSGPNGS